jgi:hypothetical protein
VILIEISRNLGTGLEPKNILIFNQNCLFHSPIGPAFLVAQSVEKRKIARSAYQAIFVGGIGRNSNRLPHDPLEKVSMGDTSLEGISYSK